MVRKSLGFFLGLIVGGTATFVYENTGQHSLPSSFPVMERQGYTVSYDTRAKIPYWTYEHITKESLKNNADRNSMEFTEDPDIHTPHRSQLADYHQSGFDRGHNAPAANVRFSKEALQETFFLSNVSPQHPQLNRGLWAKLEKTIRILASETDWVNVTTGPLFLAHDEADGKRYVTYQVIGKNDVAVPTHFFKVIETPERTWAYVVPNGPINGTLNDYLFSIQELEKPSGIRLTKP